jgi:hypothetical protein
MCRQFQSLGISANWPLIGWNYPKKTALLQKGLMQHSWVSGEAPKSPELRETYFE